MATNAFLTQSGETIQNVKRDIEQLEVLLAGVNQTSQATQFLKKKHEMRQVDDALQLMKETYRERMEACDERQTQLEFRQTKMREQVAKFDKFIQENDAKRQRAELKAKQEHKALEAKCREWAELQQRQSELENEQSRLLDRLQRLRKYKDFLDKTIEVGGHGFEEIDDLLNSYTTLKNANRDLMEQTQQYDAMLDRLRQELHTYRTEKQNLMLVAGSQINSQQKTLERRRAETRQAQEDKMHADSKAKEVVRETGQVVLAVKNMFARCVSSMRHKQGLTSAVRERERHVGEHMAACLEVIHTRIVDAMEITEEYKLYKDDGQGTRNILSNVEQSMGAETKESATRTGTRAVRATARIAEAIQTVRSTEDDRSRASRR